MTRRWERFKPKTDPDNGMLVGANDCHCDTEREAVVNATINLCQCGRPGEVQDLIVDALRCVDGHTKDLDEGNDREHLFSMKRIENLILSNPDIAAEFLMQFLDDRGLLEHGGSVGGSWLSDRGKQVIEIDDREKMSGMSAHERLKFQQANRLLGVNDDDVRQAVEQHREWKSRFSQFMPA